MPDHTLSEIFAVLNANDTYRKLEKVLQRGMRPSDDYQKFLFAYLAHGNGLRDQKGHALNPTHTRTPILFTSEEMHVLQVAVHVVKRQPSFNAQQLTNSLNYHQEKSPKTPPSIVDSDKDEDWYHDTVLDNYIKSTKSNISDATKQNPYCITIATKRKLDEFQCEVWTLPELLRLNQSRLVEEFHKWREAGFAPSSPPSVIWDGLKERFIHHYVRYYEVNQVIQLWDTAWTEYWLIVALFGKPKEIPQKLIENQSKLPNGQGLISSNANAEHLTENDFLLGTQDNFMEFIQKRCAPVED